MTTASPLDWISRMSGAELDALIADLDRMLREEPMDRLQARNCQTLRRALADERETR